MAATGPPAAPPHYHSVEQMVDAVKAGLRASQLAHVACTEPMLIALQATTPAGERITLATASGQPVGGKKRTRDAAAPDDSAPRRRSHGACHLFKHEQAGVVPYLKELLKRDAPLRAAVLTAPDLCTSKKGRHITNASLLAANLADKVWAHMSAEEKHPWKAAASEHATQGLDWAALSSAAKRCKTFIRFVASLQARVGANGVDASGLPPLLRLFM
jgi:hypothetical protein